MNKNKKVLIISVSFILVFCIFVIGYYIFNKSNIDTNNHCVLYVRNFLYTSPKSEALLEEIEQKTSDFLSENSYNKGFYLSDFHKKYIKDATLYGTDKESRGLIKQQYFNEVIMLRMKILAIKGNVVEHNELFDKYIIDIENNINTRGQYIHAYLYDENYSLEYNDDVFVLIEDAYVTTYQKCEDMKLKFILLNEIIEFYKNFDECIEKQDFYRSELNKLIQSNKDVLQSVLEEDYY